MKLKREIHSSFLTQMGWTLGETEKSHLISEWLFLTLYTL